MAEFTLFDTPVGRCAIVRNDRGVAGILLPGVDDEATRAAVNARFPRAREASPSADVQRIVDAIVAMLRDGSSDLTAIAIDMEGVPEFARRVYEVARTIPPGKTLSYGEVAELLGKPPEVASEVAQAASEVAEAAREIALEIDVDEALRHLRTADKQLGRLIDRVGPFTMRVARTQSLFAALARAIVYQQLTGKAAATIFGRVKALFPGAGEGFTADGLLGVSDDKLREAGLSRSKLLSLRDLARKMIDGHLPSIDEVHAMGDAAVIERLIEVRGIGRWTAEMLLMFRLGRPDVLPVDDYGIRKGFAATFGLADLPKKEELEKRGARWKPYRTVASWYLWRAAELEKKKLPATPPTQKTGGADRTAKKRSATKRTAKKPSGKGVQRTKRAPSSTEVPSRRRGAPRANKRSR